MGHLRQTGVMAFKLDRESMDPECRDVARLTPALELYEGRRPYPKDEQAMHYALMARGQNTVRYFLIPCYEVHPSPEQE